MELPAGLRERYRVEAVLGEGGFGVVYRALDLSTDERVALKLLTAPDTRDALSRFDREARTTASLRHPHIVGVLEHGVTEGGVPFIAYQLVEGLDLAAWRRNHGRPDPARLVTWAEQGASALACLHRVGVVHRDVKPANFLCDENQDLCLTDLGIAWAPTGTVRTATGILLGTPLFMAPELWTGEPVSPASDQWAWAATVLWCWTGTPVYGGSSPGEIVAESRRLRALEVVDAARPPAPLRDVLGRALAGRAEHRFPDMDSFRRAIGVRATPPSPEPGAPTMVQGAVPGRVSGGAEPASTRRPVLLAAGALVACLGVFAALLPSRPTAAPATAPSPTRATPVESAHQRLQRAKAAAERFTDVARDLQKRINGDHPASPWRVADDQDRQESLERLAAPGVEHTWRTFLEALGDLVLTLEPDLSPEARADVAPFLYRDGDLTIFLRDTLKLGRGRIKEHVALGANIFRPGGRPLRQVRNDLATWRLSWEALSGDVDRLLERLRIAVPEPSPGLETLLAMARLEGPREGAAVAARDIALRLPFRGAFLPPGQNARLAAAALEVLAGDLEQGVPDCEPLRALCGKSEVLEEPPGSTSSARSWRRRVRARFLAVALSHRAHCHPPVSLQALEEILGLLGELPERPADQEVDRSLTSALEDAVDVSGALVRSPEPSRRVPDALAQRIRELLERRRTPGE